MKKTLYTMSAMLLLALSLTACGAPGADSKDKSETSSTSQTQQAQETQETKTVHGIINKIDTYLVLLTDEGAYQVMDYGEGVVMDGFNEGDSVDVTYTGQLGVETDTPVITAIAMAK